MADPSLFDALRISPETLIALDNRTFHFAVQPFHYLLRMTHIVSMAAFFGGIVLFDLRLIGLRSKAQLSALSSDTLPWLYIIFGVATGSGVLLFFYDPLHVGSRAYFVPKLIAVVLGIVNAVLYHRFAYEHALVSETGTPRSAQVAGALSLAFWIGVMVFSSMNAEGVPKVLLR